MARAPLYTSRPIRWRMGERRVRSYVVSEGSSRYNELVFNRNRHIHEHAMWMLKLQAKYERWPWWRVEPPARVFGIRFIEVGPWERAVGWVLTAVALYHAVRR